MNNRTLILFILLSSAWVPSCKTEVYSDVCVTNADCTPPSICGEGICRPACLYDSDCNRAEQCINGVCIPCPGNECRPDRDTYEPGDGILHEKEGQSTENDLQDALFEHDSAEKESEYTELGEPADSHFEPDADAFVEKDTLTDQTDQFEAGDNENQGVITGTCVPGGSNCPQGYECAKVMNVDDFPPECRRAYWEDGITPDCYTCAKTCSNASDCENDQYCLGTGQGKKACLVLYCDSWKKYPPSVRAAPVGAKEASGYWTFSWTTKNIKDGHMVLEAYSKCMPLGIQGLDSTRRVTITFNDKQPSSTLEKFQVGSEVKIDIFQSESDLCVDQWEAGTGEFLAASDIHSHGIFVNAGHFVFNRVATPKQCSADENKTLLALNGIFGGEGKGGLDSPCDDSSSCLQGYVCSLVGTGQSRCRPECSLDFPAQSGCYAKETCRQDGIDSSLYPVGGCVSK